MEKPKNKEIKFGMFGGVFTPSILTIICVVLFLRTGWLVGNCGLWGALLIIVIAHTVTFTTGLSISSVTTNIRIGAGGAYSIIARSLGLEIGGAIGIPLYLSQAISVAFYIAGFTEAFVYLFPPDHPAQNQVLISWLENEAIVSYRQAVAITTWAVLATVAYIGAHWAVRIHYFIMACIGVSLVSFFFGKYPGPSEVTPQLWGEFPDETFWVSFAIFFPAVTGIMAGVSMSGDLKQAKKAIPQGVMLAIGVGFLVYIGGAIAYSFQADTQTLLTNYSVMYDTSLIGWAFYAGVFAATLSSALGSIVAAPRVLYALGEHDVIPFSRFFSRKSITGQPRNAVLLTGLISLVFILGGTLNTIAQLLTVFFLITYGMVNLVTFIEQAIGIVSFRPSLRIPLFVPLYGAVACLIIMFLFSPIAGVLAILITSGIYFLLVRAHLKVRWGDVRSGLFSTIAGWAARQAVHLPRSEKSWRPDLLLPLEEPRDSATVIKFAHDLCYPGGSVIAFSVTNQDRDRKLAELDKALEPIHKDKMFFVSSVVEGDDFERKARTTIQLLQETFFRPNVLLISLSDNPEKDEKIHYIVHSAIEENMGIAILKRDPELGFKNRKVINLVLRENSPNKDLGILLALQLHRNWEAAHINLVSLAADEQDHETQNVFFRNLMEEARLPHKTSVNVIDGSYPDDLDKIPECDIAIFGLGKRVSLEEIRTVQKNSNVSCLFMRDSGYESAFA